MSNEQLYNVIYAGAIANGFKEQAVKAKFVSQLNIPVEKVDRLFSGQRMVLKKSVSKSKAETWQRKLELIGAETAIIPFVDTNNVAMENKEVTVSNKQDSDFSQVNFGNSTLEQKNSLDDPIATKSGNGASQQQYDENMDERIRSAKEMISEQQLTQQLSEKKVNVSFANLIKFSIVLAVLIGFLYFYVGLIT